MAEIRQALRADDVGNPFSANDLSVLDIGNMSRVENANDLP